MFSVKSRLGQWMLLSKNAVSNERHKSTWIFTHFVDFSWIVCILFGQCFDFQLLYQTDDYIKGHTHFMQCKQAARNLVVGRWFSLLLLEFLSKFRCDNKINRQTKQQHQVTLSHTHDSHKKIKPKQNQVHNVDCQCWIVARIIYFLRRFFSHLSGSLI